MLRSCILLLLCARLCAAVYYIDFTGGSDSNDGSSPESAWQHCPGDSAAADLAKACRPQAGDTFRLKGGVRYFGSISVSHNGNPETPIIYDGNLDGSYGKGPAIIDGSQLITTWTACSSAAEADGNPNWKEIYYTDIDSDAGWKLMNLHNLEHAFPIAQDPNMPDPHYQEMSTYFHKSEQRIREDRSHQIKAIGMKINPTRPLVAMFDNSSLSAVINDINNGAVEISMPEAATIQRIGISPQPNYTNPEQIRVQLDGTDIMTIHPEAAGKKVKEQFFDLPAPVQAKTLTFYFEGAHADSKGKARDWGAIAKIAAYDADGKNLLLTTRRSFLQHSSVFAQSEADYWDGATISVYAAPAMVYYHPVKQFIPDRHEVEISLFTAAQYSNGGSFSILNTLKVLDRPGEYVVKKLSDNKKRIYFWPQYGLEDLRISKHQSGFNVSASHITIRGFHIRGQGGKKSGSGIHAYKKDAEGLTVQHCDIALCRGTAPALYIAYISNTLVEHCRVHNNSLHAKGLLARLLDNIIVRNCTFERNTSTAFDYYTVSNGAVLDCLVRDNQGMHANGLTFYVGCKNIIVEGNEIYDGNAGITFQDGENMIIRNNIIESKHSTGIGVWAGKVYNKIIICNNIIRGNRKSGAAQNAIFGGNPGTTGLAVYNNIIDGGFDGNIAQKAHFDNNIFVSLGSMTTDDIIDNNRHVNDINTLFVDADKRDYCLKAGSPAASGGRYLPGITLSDKLGNSWDDKPAIGPYHPDSPGGFRQNGEVASFTPPADFIFQEASIKGPDYSKPQFKHADNNPLITLTGAAFSGQGGGNVRIKKEARNIYGWDNKGHWLEWTLEAADAGNYEICLKVSTATVSKRDFFINGSAIADLQSHGMTYTASWNKWTDHYLPVPIPLEAGKNILKINGAGGSLNVIEIRAYKIVD